MKNLVIFLHGVGSRGSDFEALGRQWSQELSDVSFAFPDAPFAFDQGGPGRQWFSVRGVTPANRQQRVVEARSSFDTLIGEIVAEKGPAGHLDRVALVGFSQGAIMALDVLASGRWPAAVVVAFSGRLASPEPLAPHPGSRALLVHGSADSVMPVAEALAAQAKFEEAGVSVERHILADVGHTIPQEGSVIARNYLVQVFAQT